MLSRAENTELLETLFVYHDGMEAGEPGLDQEREKVLHFIVDIRNLVSEVYTDEHFLEMQRGIDTDRLDQIHDLIEASCVSTKVALDLMDIMARYLLRVQRAIIVPKPAKRGMPRGSSASAKRRKKRKPKLDVEKPPTQLIDAYEEAMREVLHTYNLEQVEAIRVKPDEIGTTEEPVLAGKAFPLELKNRLRVLPMLWVNRDRPDQGSYITVAAIGAAVVSKMHNLAMREAFERVFPGIKKTSTPRVFAWGRGDFVVDRDIVAQFGEWYVGGQQVKDLIISE